MLLAQRFFGADRWDCSSVLAYRRDAEMLDSCAERGITCDIELIGIEQINEACEADAEERSEIPVRDRHGEVTSRSLWTTRKIRQASC
jgi:hypothetical protein